MNWKDAAIEPAAEGQLSAFCDLILEWNPRINLTGFRTAEEIREKLFLPCIWALKFVSLAGKDVLDFGSGAGIPGLVWAICSPKASIHSLEIRQKKVAFQKEVIRQVGLNSEAIAGLFPDAIRGRQFDVIASRAIRFSEKLWAAAETHLREGGVLVRFGSGGEDQAGWRSEVFPDGSRLLLRSPAR